jgi:hypothetical protein
MKVKLTKTVIGRLRPKKREYTCWDAAVKHFGIRVTPTGEMRYIHFIRKDGRVKKSTLGDVAIVPLKKARTSAEKLNIQFEREGIQVKEAKVKTSPTLTEWVESV